MWKSALNMGDKGFRILDACGNSCGKAVGLWKNFRPSVRNPQIHRLFIRHACGNVENRVKVELNTDLPVQATVEKLAHFAVGIGLDRGCLIGGGWVPAGLFAKAVHQIAHHAVKIRVAQHQRFDLFHRMDHGCVMLAAKLAADLRKTVFG